MKTRPEGTSTKSAKRSARTSKDVALDAFRADPNGQKLTTDQGGGVVQTNDSLKGGLRGPTLLEDFHLREKITRFDHERIPERVVHARGSGAHGSFYTRDPAQLPTSRQGAVGREERGGITAWRRELRQRRDAGVREGIRRRDRQAPLGPRARVGG